jgi:hypothetical protein
MNSAFISPVAKSSVTASKSTTASNTPDVLMNALSAWRLSSCSFEPWAWLVALNALVSVAPITRTPGMRAHFGDALAHGGGHRVDRGVAVLGEIIDAFEPDHGGDARPQEHVALEARPGGRSARIGLSAEYRGGPAT